MPELLTIKQHRVMKGLTQREMAQLLGITQATYSAKESGKVKWTIPDIVIIKRLFDCKADDLAEMN